MMTSRTSWSHSSQDYTWFFEGLDTARIRAPHLLLILVVSDIVAGGVCSAEAPHEGPQASPFLLMVARHEQTTTTDAQKKIVSREALYASTFPGRRFR